MKIVRNDIKLLLLNCYQAKMYSSKIYLSKKLHKNWPPFLYQSVKFWPVADGLIGITLSIFITF